MTIAWKLTSLLLAAAPLDAFAAEQWIIGTDLWGNTSYQTLQLDTHGERLQGTLDGDAVAGSRTDGGFSFTVTDKEGQVSHYRGRIDDARMRGESDQPDTNDRAARAAHAFTGWRVPDRTQSAPQVHRFTPTDYSNTFSADRPPVLVIHPGDSVQTRTLDSGGVDERGITRALYGNPQVGPFFVVGAEAGDTLAITLVSLKLNRDYADSLDGLVDRLKTARVAGEASALGKPVRWQLDRARGIARPQGASGALKAFEVPVKPMLGGLALAPGFGYPPISTGDTHVFGGNMDFNAVVEGNTVFLPVQQPGALLYLGDGHALQGDGETTQWALETSLDVIVKVDLVKRQSIATPRVESPTQLMALGQGGSSDDALRLATAGMLQWLRQSYGLTLSEATQVLGVAVQYNVANLAGRSVGVAAKIDKTVLRTLTPVTAPAK
ncbi:acetamidase/formamidase family protein [Stenotrophomonas sp. 169]|uniref:acetamidase/formamidase family protein n=1 Tax=Stenotrophomonas sp. 169 TaxID=2770322 RepID=UPI0016622543|nr:acetamidase/formamidase family protein [Stenotrophomonas sp. 169]QNR96978.1 acetamidase/formamidase family protein [Stenotrophomonas sp. 169]